MFGDYYDGLPARLIVFLVTVGVMLVAPVSLSEDVLATESQR